MKSLRAVSRILVPASLVVLAACQTTPSQTPTTTTAPTAQTDQRPADSTVQAARQGAPVAVFLADTENQAGWTPVQIQAGTLYVNPQPVLTRDDLVGVKAGTSQQGDGLVALTLSDIGKRKVSDITRNNPNKRLALVVGHTMLAAPSYTTEVTAPELVFAVGTEQNAVAAVRAIAGAQDDASTNTGGTVGTGATTGTGTTSPVTGTGAGSAIGSGVQ